MCHTCGKISFSEQNNELGHAKIGLQRTKKIVTEPLGIPSKDKCLAIITAQFVYYPKVR